MLVKEIEFSVEDFGLSVKEFRLSDFVNRLANSVLVFFLVLVYCSGLYSYGTLSIQGDITKPLVCSIIWLMQSFVIIWAMRFFVRRSYSFVIVHLDLIHNAFICLLWIGLIILYI